VFVVHRDSAFARLAGVTISAAVATSTLGLTASHSLSPVATGICPEGATVAGTRHCIQLRIIERAVIFEVRCLYEATREAAMAVFGKRVGGVNDGIRSAAAGSRIRDHHDHR
jgi:hypothetical protein